MFFTGASVDGRIPDPVIQFKKEMADKVVEFQITKRVNTVEFQRCLKNADILFTVPYGNLTGKMPAKLFQYISWGKPILLGGNDQGMMEAFLKPYSLAFIFETPEKVEKSIMTVFDRLQNKDLFKTNKILNTELNSVVNTKPVYLRIFFIANSDCTKKSILWAYKSDCQRG